MRLPHLPGTQTAGATLDAATLPRETLIVILAIRVATTRAATISTLPLVRQQRLVCPRAAKERDFVGGCESD